MMHRSTSKPRRSFVLLAVMILTGSALFIVTALIHLMLAQSSIATSAREVEQSRSLIRSGIAVIIDELNRQRDVILDGERPRVDEQYILFEDAAELGVLRVLPLGPDGELLVAEAGKLDINTASAEMLERTDLIDPSLARAIIAFRDKLGRPVQSAAELLFVEGMRPDDLYGPLEDLTVLDQAQLDQGDLGDRLLATYGGGEIRGLADLLTVFSYEPALQRNGKLRINLNVSWSEELGDRLTDRFGEEIANGVKQIMQGGNFQFENDQKFFELLVFFEADDPSEWIEYVDAFSFEPNDYLSGRLDLNTASVEALQALPGLEPEHARAIVDARDSLGRDGLATVVWPALEGICETRQYPEFGGLITNRCWNWRVRLAAGTVDAEDPDGPLREPVIIEAVIDLSEPRARVAYLRDITQLQTAAFLALNASDSDRFDDERIPADDTPGPAPDSAGTGMDESADSSGRAENSDFSGDNPESDDEADSADSAGRDVGRADSARSDERDEDDEDVGGDVGADAGPQRVGRFRSGG